MACPSASSPLSSPPPTQSFTREVSATEQGRPYRPTKELPFELSQHVQTYYEENLFTQAYNFLLSITSSTASSTNHSAPVVIPPPSHFALAATIAIHPVCTTRTNSREKWDQANSALRYLRLVHTAVGPLNADFVTAFSFRKYDFRFSRYSDVRDDGGDEDAGGEGIDFRDNDLHTPYARSQALWTRAEDFWQLVGWAFNCACLPGIHADRWNHYRLLLEYLLDVLETDWQSRTTSANSSPEESLIWQYIELAGGGSGRARRIIRAIFADGSTRSTNEFRAIFANELKEPEQDSGKIKKREAINIDQDIYGDYLARDEEDFSDEGDGASTGTGASGRPYKRIRTRTRTPSSRRVTPRSSTGSLQSAYADGEESSSTTLGDSTSLPLRLRLMRLLTYISSHPTVLSTSPTTFPDTEDLFTLFVEFIRPLSLQIFAQMILPSPAPMSTASHPTQSATGIFAPSTLTTLCESLLQRLLENSAPSIRSNVLLSQQKLEDEYLLFAASKNSIDANARVSLLLESLTRSLASAGVLKRTEALRHAVRKGVERRMGKVLDAGEGRKRKVQKREEDAWTWLVESGERIERVVDGLEEG